MAIPASSQGTAIRAENLGKKFFSGIRCDKESFLSTTRRLVTGWTNQRELWALRNVSFELNKGETLGIIGPNGAGKSTLLLLLAKILGPTEGECHVSTKTHCFFRLGAALQGRLTVKENFSLCSTLLGLDRAEFRRRLPAMIAFSGLEDYLYARYGELSSGLAARLPFAAAIHADLDTILVDEMLMVGDRDFQSKCIKTFHDLKARGKTLVIVSHDLNLIGALCPKALYLKAGRMVFMGNTAEAVSRLIRDTGAPARSMAGPVELSGGDCGDTDFQEQIRKIVREEVGRIRLDLEAFKNGFRRTAPLVEETVPNPVMALEKPAPAPVSRVSELASTEVELAWKGLLGHTGPLAVCSSVPAAFGTVIQALMNGSVGRRLEPGDEVILKSGKGTGLIQGLLSYGLVPVFVDLDPETFNISIKQLSQALSERTRIVIIPHGGTCSPVGQVAAFCSENDLRLVEVVCAAGRYDGRFLGTIGDFGVYVPPDTNSNWGLALSRQEAASRLFDEILSGAAGLSLGAGGRACDDYEELFRHPARAGGAGLSASLAACRDCEAQLPEFEKGFSAYSDFFNSFPDCFAVPRPPPLARMNSPYFLVCLKKRSPFTRRELLDAAIYNNGIPMRYSMPQSSPGKPLFRKVDSLPHTIQLNERGVMFSILLDVRERQRFFGELSAWIKNRPGP